MYVHRTKQQGAPADGDAMEDSEEGGGEGGEGDKSSPASASKDEVPSRELVTVTPYKLPNPGPYPHVRDGSWRCFVVRVGSGGR